MKKILIALLAVFALAACNHKASAQIATLYTNTDSSANGTYTTIGSGTTRDFWDANTIYTMYSKTGHLKSSNLKGLKVEFTVTKVTGTVAATMFLQGSDDGVNWYNLNTTSAAVSLYGTHGRGSDSLSVGSVTTSRLYSISWCAGCGHAFNATGIIQYAAGLRPNYVRLKIVAAGTQRTTISGAKVYAFQ